MMKAMRAEQQRDLFEVNDPPITLCEQHKHRLLPLVRAMLLEILTPVTGEEVSHDEGQH
jgi:hypothetical protein